MEKAYLVLENGAVFEGVAFGAPVEKTGELVFTTNVVGYLETLSDAAYYGQIVLQTFPLIGNYGIIPQDFEGECHLSGYVVRECCENPSNFRSEGDLDSFLKEKGIPGIAGVDTRAITRMLRDQGIMNARICREVPADLSEIKEYRIANAVQAVSVKAPVTYEAEGTPCCRIALLDLGAKKSTIEYLRKRGAAVTVLPACSTADQVLATGADGLLLSGGPGNPEDCAAQVETIRALLGKLPIFGIGLGHQLLALAAGGKTERLPYGHRGASQPVKDLSSNRTYITGQNHGYVVRADSLPGARVRFVNANDMTCEGLEYDALRAFSVQFDPEISSGPNNCSFLFDRFFELMGGDCACR